MENENPSYYAIIPADVRYDKRLKANEKLMFGEITCLSNKLGYCFSSNNYFAELYDVTPQAISGWIKNLEKCGYITCEYLHNGTEIKERRIRIVKDTNSTNDEKGNSTKLEKGINKSLKGYKQNFKDNNTSNNNTRKNNTSIVGYSEIVELYFSNFKALYEQGKVANEKPYFTNISGDAVKNILKKLSLDEVKIILNNAMSDNWIVSNGYAITTIFAESQINKLLNGKYATSQNCGYVNNKRPASDNNVGEIDF